jgi:hypothetical protein
LRIINPSHVLIIMCRTQMERMINPSHIILILQRQNGTCCLTIEAQDKSSFVKNVKST